jgi:hypothetical protein
MTSRLPNIATARTVGSLPCSWCGRSPKRSRGRQTPKTLNLSEVLQRSEKDIFDYFAEEVFSREDEETQDLLMHLSCSNRCPCSNAACCFPTLRCSATLCRPRPKRTYFSLPRAEMQNYPRNIVFTRCFAISCSGGCGQRSGRPAFWPNGTALPTSCLENRQWELALPFLLDAENFARAAEVIAERGEEWIAAGAHYAAWKRSPIACPSSFSNSIRGPYCTGQRSPDCRARPAGRRTFCIGRSASFTSKTIRSVRQKPYIHWQALPA